MQLFKAAPVQVEAEVSTEELPIEEAEELTAPTPVAAPPETVTEKNSPLAPPMYQVGVERKTRTVTPPPTPIQKETGIRAFFRRLFGGK